MINQLISTATDRVSTYRHSSCHRAQRVTRKKTEWPPDLFILMKIYFILLIFVIKDAT